MLADHEAIGGSGGEAAGPIYRRLRRLLFAVEAERAHELGLAALRLLQGLPPLRREVARRSEVGDRRLRQQQLGAVFANPIGLAAGFDKNAVAVGGVEALGFGFVEVGTVTPRPQPGNPRPRLFRYPEHASLQNALGFNNLGVEGLARRLAGRRPRVPLGINIGRNRDTPPEAAADDYRRAVAALGGCCDYFVVNVSSPNTPGLRDLQERHRLEELLTAVGTATERPFLVKLSPDLDRATAIELSAAAVGAGAEGVVLTNTTTDYALLPGARPEGGLSGRVLRERSFALLDAVARELFGRCLLISVGGIETAAEVYRRLRRGAALVQLYTALVYAGPGLPRRLNGGLLDLLERDGARDVQEVIGADL